MAPAEVSSPEYHEGTGKEAHDHAGIVLSYIASGFSVICCTDFAVEIPVAGGSFAYLCVKLGDAAALQLPMDEFLSVLNTMKLCRTAHLGPWQVQALAARRWVALKLNWLWCQCVIVTEACHISARKRSTVALFSGELVITYEKIQLSR
jgi:amino acid transporter